MTDAERELLLIVTNVLLALHPEITTNVLQNLCQKVELEAKVKQSNKGWW